MTSWFQTTLTLPSRAKGFYIITDEIRKGVPHMAQIKTGMCNIFLQHTSAAITINENWDKDTRLDLSDAMDAIVPEHSKYRHSAEGPDDMPSHVKSSLLSASITIPITNGTLNLGTWQDVQLAEFRTSKHQRKIVVTVQGEKK